MSPRDRWLPFVMAVLIALLMVAPAGAQDATPAGDAPIGVLGEIQVDALPSPDAEVWFIRFELKPGRSLPLGLQIGPTVIVVETGELTFTTDQEIEVSGGTPAAATEVGDGMHDAVVAAGQTVYVREDTTLAMRNDGEEDASLLALLTFSPQREEEQMQEESGSEEASTVPPQPLGLARAAFPEGPGTITLERVALEPGATETMDVSGGAAVGGVERGSLALAVEEGDCYLWPGLMAPAANEQMSGPDELSAGDTGDLAMDDGFGCWDASVEWQAGDEGATVIRARVLPAT